MDVTPLSCTDGTTRSELVVWPGMSPAPVVRIDVLATAEALELAPASGCERLLLVVAGEGASVVDEESEGRTRLRRFDSYPLSGDRSPRLVPEGGPLVVLDVLTRGGEARATAEALALGRRGAREELEAGQALLFVASGSLVARLTDEDEPFELEARDGLWLRGLRGGEEVALEGTHPDCVVALIGLATAERES